MNIESTSPIGVFDSGLGGLSVLATIHALLPGENLIYYGDSANAPYGEKNRQQVRLLSTRICDTLVEQGAKAIVIACNTATSAAVSDLRKRYDIPIVGMEPALKPAVEQTETGAVAVLATALTLRESKFQGLLEQFRTGRRIYSIPCPELVTLVESGVLSGEKAEIMVAESLKGLDKDKLAAVVLGCTHYVFLRQVFEKTLGGKTLIVDGNRGTVLHLKKLLGDRHMLTESQIEGTIRIDNSAGEALIARSWMILEHYRMMEEKDNARTYQKNSDVFQP